MIADPLPRAQALVSAWDDATERYIRNTAAAALMVDDAARLAMYHAESDREELRGEFDVALVRDLCALAESQAARVSELEHVLKRFTRGGTMSGMEDGKSILYCAHCHHEWLYGEPEAHDVDCTLWQARALLEVPHDDR